MRRKEDRLEFLQRAYTLVEEGLEAGANGKLASAIKTLIECLAEDPYEFTEDANLHAGRKNQPNDFPNDFRHESGTTAMRGLKFGDIGDPPDLDLCRVGPDGVSYDYDGEWEECPPGTAIASIRFRAWNPNTQWDEVNAQITGRAQGTGKGSLSVYTNGNLRWTWLDDGKLDLTGLSRNEDMVSEYIEVVVDGQVKKLRLE